MRQTVPKPRIAYPPGRFADGWSAELDVEVVDIGERHVQALGAVAASRKYANPSASPSRAWRMSSSAPAWCAASSWAVSAGASCSVIRRSRGSSVEPPAAENPNRARVSTVIPARAAWRIARARTPGCQERRASRSSTAARRGVGLLICPAR